MAGVFFIKGDPLKQLNKLNKRQLRAFQNVSAGVLNTMAFITMKGQKETLTKDNIIRTPSLLRKAFRVKKAVSSKPIMSQRAEAGSIETKRHDAWEAIDQGLKTRATMFNDEGRVGGSERGKAKKAARSGSDRTNMSDFKLRGTGEARANDYLQAISSSKKFRRKPFNLPRKHNKMRRGVYKFVGGSVGTYKSGKRKFKRTLTGASIVRLSKPAGAFTPEKTNWSKRTVKRELTDQVVGKIWKGQMKRELKKIKGRTK